MELLGQSSVGFFLLPLHLFVPQLKLLIRIPHCLFGWKAHGFIVGGVVVIGTHDALETSVFLLVVLGSLFLVACAVARTGKEDDDVTLRPIN